MVFDLDGTVVDSVELIIVSFQHAIREVLGREMSREDAIAWVGRPLREQMELFSPEHADELVEVYREFNHREHDRMLKLYDGILHLLEGLRKAGVKVGLVTSKSRFTTQMAFDLTGHRGLLRRHRLRRRGGRQQALAGPHPGLPGAAGGGAAGSRLRGRQPLGHPGGSGRRSGRDRRHLGRLPGRQAGG